MFGLKTKLYKIINSAYEKVRKNYDRDSFELKLENSEFTFLRGVNIEKISKIMRVHGKDDIVSSIIEIGKPLLHKYYSVECKKSSLSKGCSCICVLSRHNFERKEMISRYEKVVQFIDNKECVYGNNNNFSLSIEGLRLALLWFRQMPRNGDVEIKLRLISAMLEAWQIIKSFKSLPEGDRNTIERCIVMCDFQPVDSVVVQYFNFLGIETISLQHGSYGSGVGTIENCVANKILVYGKHDSEELVKAGISKDRIVLAGMPQMIGIEEKRVLSTRVIKKVGVVCSGAFGYIPDLKMMNVLLSVNKEKKWDLYLKIRTDSIKESYKGLVEKYGFKGIYSDELSSIDFIDEMDAIICGISTMTLESIVRMKPTFVYSENMGESFDKLSDFKFLNGKELIKLIDFYEIDTDNFQFKLKQVKDYFCANNIDQNYKLFLEHKFV